MNENPEMTFASPSYGGPDLTATVRVLLLDVGSESSRTLEVPAGAIDPSERGVLLGQVFVPWHRVARLSSLVRQASIADVDEDRVRVWVRAVVQDEGGKTRTFTVPASRFETGDWHLTVLIPQRVEPDEGVMVVEKLSFPWHRVVEFEREIREVHPRPAEVALEPREPADAAGPIVSEDP